MAPKAVSEVIIDLDPVTYETQNVHEVYDKIASHFSSTRYKVGTSSSLFHSPILMQYWGQPWPIIANFLSEIPDGWVGLDSGTGNGKYLPLDRQGKIWTIGLDRSINLLRIAQEVGGKARDVVLGNVLDQCWRTYSFVRG